MFNPAFGAPFRPPFDPGGKPWYLIRGGVAAANCIAAYQPKGAASQALSYKNLVSPGTHDAAPGTAPTWDTVNGWKFDASVYQYLTTDIVPQSTWSMFIQFSNGSGATLLTLAGGYVDDTYSFVLQPHATATNHRYYNDALITVAGYVNSGNMGIAGKTCWLNGVSDGTLGAGSATQTRAIYIAALNFGVVIQHFSCYIQSMVIYNVTINPAQALILSTAMAAL